MRPFLALARKDLIITRRAPLFAAVSILVPVAFTFLYAIVIHVSTTSTIVVADEDHTPQSAAFIAVMETMHNDDGNYYEILTTDPERAHQMYRDGEAGAVLTIPSGFGEKVTRGGRPTVTLSVVNINADGTKNQHLRVEEALRQYQQQLAGTPGGRLQITESTVLDHDIPVTVYLGSALIVFAALYAGMINVGVGIAREWEDRTAKSLVLAPGRGGALVAGKWIAGAVTSLATLAVAIGGIGWILGYPLSQFGWRSFGAVTLVWSYGAALGTLLGVTLRKSLPLVPVAVIISVGHFLLCGYESYIRGFAHGGVVEPLWLSTQWIPLGRIIDAVRFEVAALPQPAGIGASAAASLLIAGAGIGLAAWRLTRSIRFAQGQ